MDDVTNTVSSPAGTGDVPGERRPRVVPGGHYKSDWERYGYSLNLRLNGRLKEKIDAYMTKTHARAFSDAVRFLIWAGLESYEREEKRKAERMGY